MVNVYELFSSLPHALRPLREPPPDLCIEQICTDAAEVTPGALYCAFRGLRADGHTNIPLAIQHGAACILLEDPNAMPLQSEIPFLLCKDVRACLSALYLGLHGNPQQHLRLIGVTGTNGKTSVSTILYQTLLALGKRAALIGTVCNEIDGIRVRSHMTTPAPQELAELLHTAVRKGVEYVVMEVSSHALQQQRCNGLSFHAGIFTGLSPEHLDYHTDMEHYFAAKRQLLLQSRICLCNASCTYTTRLIHDGALCGKGYTYALAPTHADFIATRLFGSAPTCFSLAGPGFSVRIRSPLLGNFAAENLTAAISCAVLLGFDAEKSATAAAAVRVIPGRMETVWLPCPFRVLIDYAHTPQALENALLSARTLCRKGGKLLLVFGCGGDRDRSKRPVMGSIAAKAADLVFLTQDNSRSEPPEQILSEVLTGFPKNRLPVVIPDRRDAIVAAYQTAQRGDVLLLCGKGHETYEITAQGKRPFSEREILYAIAGKGKQADTDTSKES